LYKQAVLDKFKPGHWVHNTFKNLKTDSIMDIDKLFAHLNYHDKYRNQNWKTVYPEFLKWYPNHAN